MPFAGFKDFEACETKMKERYPAESAKKICGWLMHKYEKKGDAPPLALSDEEKAEIERYTDDLEKDAIPLGGVGFGGMIEANQTVARKTKRTHGKTKNEEYGSDAVATGSIGQNAK